MLTPDSRFAKLTPPPPQKKKTQQKTNKKQKTIIIIIIINLIYIAQFDTNGILIALYIVITYIQMQYVHV